MAHRHAEEFCLGCNRPTSADCGCPAGTGWRETRKPLFVPLKSEYFEAFVSGSKRDELRRYGPRWNERTCRVGRPVVLSKGYGKTHRIGGHIWKFKKQHGSTFGSTYRAAIERCFGTLDIDIACISIEVSNGHR